jgi:hypothetical protein
LLLGERVGYALYLKNKGDIWLSPLQKWVLPALGGSAALKFLGLSVTKAVLVMASVALFWEAAAVLLGWLEHHIGATRSTYQAAAETDPFKSESLALLRQIRDSVASSH